MEGDFKCGDCSAQLSKDHKFCPQCGAKVKTLAADTALQCKGCGTALTSDMKFCAKCGEKIIVPVIKELVQETGTYGQSAEANPSKEDLDIPVKNTGKACATPAAPTSTKSDTKEIESDSEVYHDAEQNSPKHGTRETSVECDTEQQASKNAEVTPAAGIKPDMTESIVNELEEIMKECTITDEGEHADASGSKDGHQTVKDTQVTKQQHDVDASGDATSLAQSKPGKNRVAATQTKPDKNPVEKKTPQINKGKETKPTKSTAGTSQAKQVEKSAQENNPKLTEPDVADSQTKTGEILAEKTSAKHKTSQTDKSKGTKPTNSTDVTYKTKQVEKSIEENNPKLKKSDDKCSNLQNTGEHPLQDNQDSGVQTVGVQTRASTKRANDARTTEGGNDNTGEETLKVASSMNYASAVKDNIQNKGANMAEPQTYPPRSEQGSKESRSNIPKNITANKNDIQSDPKGFAQQFGGAKADSQQNNNSSKASKAERNRLINNKPLTVVFHAVLSSAFKKEKILDVQVRFHSSQLGGYKKDGNSLRAIRNLDNDCVLYEGTAEIERHKLVDSASDGLRYNYVIICDDKPRWEVVIDMIGENINDKVGRHLHVPQKESLNAEVWHQYDGVMKRKPPDGLSKVRNYFTGGYNKLILSENMIALSSFMPEWEGLCLSDKRKPGRAEDAIRHIEMLKKCAYKWLVTGDLKRGNTVDFNEVIVSRIKDRLDVFKVTQSSGITDDPEMAQLRISSALAIVYLLGEYDIPIRDVEPKKTLFKALLLKPDSSYECHELKAIQKNFPSKDTFNKLVMHLRRFVINQSHYMSFSYTYWVPEWIYALPLIHFFCDVTVPHKEMYDTNHISDEYWGLKPVYDIEATFKESIRKQYRKEVLPYIQQLEPLFRVDQILPRSIIAFLSYSQVIDMGTHVKFPPDVLLANMSFWVKTREYIDYKDIGQIIGHIGTWTEQKLTSNTIDSVERSYAAFSIGMDYMVHLCTRVNEAYHRSIVIISTTMLCRLGSMCLKALAKQEKNVLTEKVYHNWDRLFETIRIWLHKILPAFMCFSTSSRQMASEHELNIFSSFLGMAISGEDVRNLWVKMLLQILHFRLSAVTAEQKLELFCRLDFTGKDARIEECFSRAAFDALEDVAKNKDTAITYMFDTTSKTKKLGEMMSRLFMKALPKYKDAESDEVLFNHMLEWPTFPPYLQFFSGKNEHSDILDDDTQIKMAECLSVFGTAVERLKQNGLPLYKLEYIFKRRDQFLGIYQTQCEDDSNFDMKWHIENLERDLDEFRKIKSQLGMFLSLCDTQYVSTKELGVWTTRASTNSRRYKLVPIWTTRASTSKQLIRQLVPLLDSTIGQVVPLLNSTIGQLAPLVNIYILDQSCLYV